MNKHFINCLNFTAAFFLFSAITAYGQQSETHEDHVYANPNISGVGSSTIIYHLKSPLETTVLAELENYMESLNAITQVDINGLDISIQFKGATTNQMIFPFIQRMEMLYIYRNPKSR
ncbi:hypothetical protein [Fluviicola chungangensis]|uniref:Heavy-metal-associated domain-containing protein n=1 Tax=Fluviicola chungangensis TaxID=2597671 RepID=A0A556N1A8_9FLAO|nr:hypothetical protein [Fluviicola chungangensis]TSJ45838.1 hypothetical protein FO442_08815 [Fluviicola chungangensis]